LGNVGGRGGGGGELGTNLFFGGENLESPPPPPVFFLSPRQLYLPGGLRSHRAYPQHHRRACQQFRPSPAAELPDLPSRTRVVGSRGLLRRSGYLRARCVRIYLHIYIYIYVCVCVCVCMSSCVYMYICMWECGGLCVPSFKKGNKINSIQPPTPRRFLLFLLSSP